MKQPKAGLRIGTGGVPLSCKKKDPASGVARVAELGLEAMELEFVHGVRIQSAMIEKVRQAAEQHRIALTCHGPYYINLASLEEKTAQASVQRILETARAAHLVGARSITFHAAFYMKQDPAKVHGVVRDALTRIVETLRAEDNHVQIRPELTGKPSQYGDLEELLRLSQEVPGVLPCIDFSHLHARTGGAENSAPEFKRTLGRLAEALGKQALQDLHLHVSGIEYTPKGERRHLMLPDSDMKYQDLLAALKAVDAGGVLVSESPDPEVDALLMQSTYRKL